VHIAITGIEKVIARLEHVVPLNSLVPRSATGQAVETYQNFISGPRKADELDGPDEVHLILLDNGRSQAHADLQLRATLQCIRCGACMNHCPVYARIGSHAYGTTYPGPSAPSSAAPARTRATHAGDSLTLRGASCPCHPDPRHPGRLRNEAALSPRRGSGTARSRCWRDLAVGGPTASRRSTRSPVIAAPASGASNQGRGRCRTP
jgi:L-lactate dehydrogenase complex protein LldF